MKKIKFSGVITDIKPERVFGKKNIREIEIRCSDNLDDKYPHIVPFKIKFDPTSYKINPLEGARKLKIGQRVSFLFDIKGRISTKDGKDHSYVDLQVSSDIEVTDDQTYQNQK